MTRDLSMRSTAPSSDRHQKAVDEAGVALDTWLRRSLEETEEDWMPFVDRFERDHDAKLSEDRELVQEFERFVRDELRAWDPSPPHLDTLLQYAEKFNASPGVIEALRDAIHEDQERDVETAAKLQPDTKAPPPALPESEDELDRLFRR